MKASFDERLKVFEDKANKDMKEIANKKAKKEAEILIDNMRKSLPKHGESGDES